LENYMAWNDPPNQGPKDPWGDRKKRGDEGPPDLEEMFRKAMDQIKGLFGGGRSEGSKSSGKGSSSGLAWIAGLLVLAYLAFSSFHIVEPRESGVVLRFGKFHRTLAPGPQFTFPAPIERVLRVKTTQVNSINSNGKMRMLTSDENLVDIDFAVQFRVQDANQYLFKVKDPDGSLIQVSEAAVRQIVGSKALDDVLVGNRGAITLEARDLIQSILNSYESGIEVVAVNFQDASVPMEVKEAFDDAIKAREDEPRFVNEAEAYASKVEPEAEGRAARIRANAAAYKEQIIAKAEGEARRFELLVEQYRLAPEVTRKRLYLETMQEVLKRVPKVLVDGKDGQAPLLYLPLDKMAPKREEQSQ
jgi:membrane protease subunit HflK